MFRILMFLATNIAVMALISLVFSLFGFQGLLAENGVDLDLQALLVYSAVIGFSGSIISFLLSRSYKIVASFVYDNHYILNSCTLAWIWHIHKVDDVLNV